MRANLQLPETLLTLSLVLVSFMMQVHTQQNITNHFFPHQRILHLHCESQPLYCVVSFLSLTPMNDVSNLTTPHESLLCFCLLSSVSEA